MTDGYRREKSIALSKERTHVGVIGAGAFGTCMAMHAARRGHDVLLWAREQSVVDDINATRENRKYLPGLTAPDGLTATTDLAKMVTNCELLLLAVPTPFIEATLAGKLEGARTDAVLVSCAKGILNDTLETVDEVLQRVVPPALAPRLAFLSGPSFAAEVCRELPTLVTIAAADDEVGARVQELLSSPRFRCYRTTDVAGVELGGALKNVLAIACGVSDGLQFGGNARAALITRGLNEITRLAAARGADPLTMLGLAGIGDIVLTCTGDLSRNRTVGLRIGRGESLADITASMGGAIAEGVLTSRSAHALAEKLGVPCPIIAGIYRVLHEGADPREVVMENMSRDLKPEVDEHMRRAAVRQ